MRARKILTIVAATALVAAVVAGVGLAAATVPDGTVSEPPAGYAFRPVAMDSAGNITYGYVRIDDEAPAVEENEQSLLIAQARDQYRDNLRARLEAETPYEYWRVSPGPVGFPESGLPLTMENVCVHVYVTRDDIVTAMRDILPIVVDYDPKLNRVGFIFHVPTAMYAEADVYVSELADIDWDKAALEVREQGRTKLGQQGHIALY